jgi:cell division topological specificity factor
MRELLRWLFGLADKGSSGSSEVARQRLRLVLIQDRIDLSPEKMEQMKREIWEVVSRYMVVDDDFKEFEVRRLDELVMLVSNIEVKDLSTLMSARST